MSLDRGAADMTIPEVADQFITQGIYLRGWTTSTVRTYRQGLATLYTDSPSLPTKASLQAFVVAMRQRAITPGGLNMYARSINTAPSAQRNSICARWGLNIYERGTNGSRPSRHD